MSLPTKFEVKFVEKDLVNIDFIEKEIIDVKLKCVDLLRPGSISKITEFDISNPVEGQILIYIGDKWVNTTSSELIAYYNVSEVPTKITDKIFRTSISFASADLQVFLNGLKQINITVIDSKNFELPIDSVETDTIEVVYIRQ